MNIFNSENIRDTFALSFNINIKWNESGTIQYSLCIFELFEEALHLKEIRKIFTRFHIGIPKVASALTYDYDCFVNDHGSCYIVLFKTAI